MSDHILPEVLAEQIKADRHERDTFRCELRESIAEISAQVKKTNGRVTALEQWRMFILGGFAVIIAPWATNIIGIFHGK